MSKMVSKTFCYSCEGHCEMDKQRLTVKLHCAETRFGNLTIEGSLQPNR